VKKLKIVLGALGAAIALGLLVWGTESLVEWVAKDLLPRWAVIALGLILLAAVVVALFYAAVISLIGDAERSDSEARVDALRIVGDALQGIRQENLLSSEDGQFLHALIKMPPEQWNDSYAFYAPGVASYTPELPEKDCFYYLFFVVENNRPTVLPIPFASNTITCVLTMMFEYAGFRRKLLIALKWIYSVFAEVDHWIKLIVTSACVFFRKLLEDAAVDRWRKFTSETLQNYVDGGSRGSIALPAGIKFTQLSIRFDVPSKPGLSPLIVDLDENLLKAIASMVEHIRYFAAFKVQTLCDLKPPYTAE
jgi:hypothetical protein